MLYKTFHWETVVELGFKLSVAGHLTMLVFTLDVPSHLQYIYVCCFAAQLSNVCKNALPKYQMPSPLLCSSHHIFCIIGPYCALLRCWHLVNWYHVPNILTFTGLGIISCHIRIHLLTHTLLWLSVSNHLYYSCIMMCLNLLLSGIWINTGSTHVAWMTFGVNNECENVMLLPLIIRFEWGLWERRKN